MIGWLFAGLKMKLQGHTGPTGCHVWKFMPRSACMALPEHFLTHGGPGEFVFEKEYHGAHLNDAFMFCKEYMRNQ